MKKLILFVLLMPLISFGQNFEVTDLAGYSADIPFLGSSSVQQYKGFANQVSLNYHCSKYFSFGAYEQLNAWTPLTNTAGIMAEVHYSYFYFGVNVGELFFNKVTDHEYVGFLDNNFSFNPKTGVISYTYRPNSAISCGLHFGVEYEIFHRFIYKQEIGYATATSKSEFLGDNSDVKIHALSALAGLAYRF
jgi:hypothetical protein